MSKGIRDFTLGLLGESSGLQGECRIFNTKKLIKSVLHYIFLENLFQFLLKKQPLH